MAIEILDAVERQRFEGYRDGELVGFIDYRHEEPNRLALTHAETLSAHTGRGVASAIAGHALDVIRQQGMSVRAACSFVADYLTRHPEYADLT